jgi:hypothetical protein
VNYTERIRLFLQTKLQKFIFTLNTNAFKPGSLGEFNFKQMANSNVWIMHTPVMKPNIEIETL